MKMTTSVLAAFTLLASLHLTLAADIAGKITLNGTPPPEKEIEPIKADPTCGKLHKEPVMTRFYVVGQGNGLGDVFVYLKEGVSGAPAPSAKPAVLDQKGCEYTPYVLGLQANQKLVVKNSDPVMHNIHPTPVVAGNKEQNKAQVPNGPDLEFTFEKPEVLLRFKCDVHPWMFAYVGVVEHPYFAVSDKDGNFKIANVPPGKYVVEAFHRKGGKVTQNVEVAGESKKVDFSISVAP